MKRLNNLYDQVIAISNLWHADQNARQGKKGQYGIKIFDRNPEANILQLHNDLFEQKYQTSKYTTFEIREPKVRLVYRLPYFPDRILHHAIMIVLKPFFNKLFTADSYSCIEGRGIHGMATNIKKALKDKSGTTYFLQLDIVKFYPSVDHDILKTLLRKKIKDQRLLWLLDEIIDSVEGLPIGNYLSQYFANYYLTFFDHFIKEVLGVKYYFRYADDMVLLCDNKPQLHYWLAKIREYLQDNLKLHIKGNYQVNQTKDGIDVIGYKFFPEYTLMRKSIKKRFAKAVKKRKQRATIAAYWGWAIHADTNHLIKKLLPDAKIQRFKYNPNAVPAYR